MRSERSATTSEEDRVGDQERLLPFLLDPSSYPHRPAGVRLVQTHASFVFIAPPYVYKVKKAVDFGFLDFSTLEKRKHFCEREIDLNRRLTSDVYLGVLAIRETETGFSLHGDGVAVEFAVRMRKLADRDFLDRKLARGEVGEAELDRIIEVLARFYRSQEPSAEIAEAGRVASLKVSTDENFRQTGEFVGHTISRPAYETLQAYTDGFCASHEELFASRVSGRRILDCHGDLHLEHIHLGPRSINIYDCIEFNDRFRHIDIASDIAFLAMDLDHRGAPALARYFVKRMSEVLEDPQMLLLTDFYKCYRAYVRGKVESFHSRSHAESEEERRHGAEEARRYFRLALRYAVAGSRPLVVVAMGGVATGKSTVAAALGEELGWQVVSSDRVRKELAAVPLEARGDARQRRRLYSPAMSARTYQALLEAAERAVGEGSGVILDATYGRPADRAALLDRLQAAGAEVCFLEVQAGTACRQQRLAARGHDPHVVSDARLEDFAELDRHFQPPVELPPDRLATVDAAGLQDEVLPAALRLLAARQTQ